MGLSSRYMAVALGVGIAAAGAALVDFGLGSRGLIAAAFVAVLAVLGAGDAEKRTIPNRIVLPAIALVLVAQLAFFGDRALEWLGAGAGAALLLQVPAWIRPGSVGQGDVKLALLLGVGLGREVIDALLIGSLAAFPVALWIVVRGGWDARKRAIPLGPFLAVGGILATFSGGSL
jgi:prepilin signal peptidase PulO-like enzyme (type II secretory pathway)